MATIIPKGEKIRLAVKWVSERMKEDPSKATLKLVREACRRFNLSPLEEEYLVSFYSEAGEKITD